MHRVKIAICIISDFETDQRIQKVAHTLQQHIGDVQIICRRTRNRHNDFSHKVRRINLFINKGFLFYAEFNIRLFLKLLLTPVDIIVANDADTLLPCYYASKLKGKKLVFDSHEIMSQVPEVVNRPGVQKIWQRIEKRFIPKVRYKYTVCNSLRDYYNSNFQVIRNVPFYRQNNQNNNSSSPVILYQGSLNMGRGIELMIEAMPDIPKAEFWIVGDGYEKEHLHKIASLSKASERIKFIGKVLPEDLKQLTPQATIGISIEENIGLNYYYALPNKLMDYIQAGVPVLVSDFPEMRSIVEEYQLGEILKERSTVALAVSINQLLNNDTQLNLYRNNCKKAAIDLCWEKEEQKLIEIYKSAISY